MVDIPDAEALIQRYCDEASEYAWSLYDEDPSPTTLTGANLAAPALLSYPIRGSYLNQMGSSDNPYAHLYDRMSRFVAVEPVSCFEELDAATIKQLANRGAGDPIDGPQDWRAFVECLDAVGKCSGLTSVSVTKILHRKRPDLVPLNDSRVRTFYGVRHRYVAIFSAIHKDLSDAAVQAKLDGLRSRYRTPLGRPMSRLRALDIAIWMDVGREAAR